MEHCARCGHVLGLGRYCVNCGRPRDESGEEGTDAWRSGTAERPAVRVDPSPRPGPASPTSPTSPPPPPPLLDPVAPPPVFETPRQPRYPMYADEPVEPVAPLLWGLPGTEQPLQPPAPPRRRSSVLPWVLVAVALLLVAATGVYLLVGGSGDETADDTGAAASTG